MPNETTLRDQARSLKSTGLQSLGYKYVNLDAGWSLRERDNATGRPQPDPQLFPNIANGGVAAFLHGMGFKFGIYSDSGTLHCGEHTAHRPPLQESRIMHITERCSRRHTGGGGPGGLGHESIDAQAYADWGVDFLKYDNCYVPANISHDPVPRYTAMSRALNATGRPIFFAMCEWGVADPGLWGPAVANSWRTTADISDLWWAMCELADLTAQWFDSAGPGHWNDPDLLEVGNGGMNTGEYRSQFAIWALMKAPLLISTDVTNLSVEALEVLSNEEGQRIPAFGSRAPGGAPLCAGGSHSWCAIISFSFCAPLWLPVPAVIAINQDPLGVAGRLVEERPPDPAHLQVWAGPLSGGRVGVVLWNRGEATSEILGRFVDMQFDGAAHVRDCIAHRDVGIATGQVVRNVSSHDVAVFVLTPITVVERSWTAADDAAWAAMWQGHGIRIPRSRLERERHRLATVRVRRGR